VGLLGRIVSSVPADFEVACGNAPVFYPALCAGATGGVLAVANCVPRLVVALFDAFAAGDHPRARLLQQSLTPLAAAVTATWGVAGLKGAMDLVGLRGGAVRSPLLPLSSPAREEIRILLEQARAAVP
jgi:4-hydroxy-2-oxoglutarate aldolase